MAIHFSLVRYQDAVLQLSRAYALASATDDAYAASVTPSEARRALGILGYRD